MWKENISISNCPPESATEIKLKAFRLLKNKFPTEDDFIPHARIYKRLQNKCDAYAISFYNTEDKIRNHPRLKKKGGYIGGFIIEKQDGVSKINNAGHINVWFYSSWKLINLNFLGSKKL